LANGTSREVGPFRKKCSTGARDSRETDVALGLSGAFPARKGAGGPLAPSEDFGVYLPFLRDFNNATPRDKIKRVRARARDTKLGTVCLSFARVGEAGRKTAIAASSRPLDGEILPRSPQ